jgi:rhodanese-related sulfurtransferase
MKGLYRAGMTGLLVASITFFLATSAVAEQKRITKEEVRQMFGNKDLIIIDVRSSLDWGKNELKIKGAVREDPDNAKAWIDKYPKDSIIVLYCS